MSNILSEVHPELVAEWSDKNLPLTPDRITYGSNKVVWWKGACGHEWQTSVKARSNGENCPICSGARVIEGINDLATLKPELADEWSSKNDPLKPTMVTTGSHKKVIWQDKYGHEWTATVKSRAISGTGCPYCSHNKVLEGFNDLASQRPLIASEWSERNYPLKPDMVTVFANRKVWWKCRKGHEYNNAKKAIDEAIAMSRNLRQFQYELSVMGYHSNFSPNRKYATVTPKGSEKPIRTYRLGEEYTKEKILERLIANRDNIVFKPFQPKTYIVRQYRLPTRESKIQKVGGLYGLYLYYCYRLGYLPKHNQKQQNTARLHYLLKDDLMKMDELTKQVTLLGKHQIGTDEQLFSYKRSVEDEIKTLTADRTHLRNEIRKVDISDERLSAAKIKISAISERLKELRKEVKLCDGIAKRSGVIADTLSQVKAEEEKSQRKESRNYEQRR